MRSIPSSLLFLISCDRFHLHIPLSRFWIEQDTSSPDMHRKRIF
ncbi:hypothetical protein HanLR1_Chr02g0051131 [Helianthus annuus]|nr:hypothetical protein HanHA89_Chr02g0053551 [Helianthus annuus]KAJ0776910.1 hypothetical protein HanLR1_Chr02g0051131 [Helianthus annuus]